MTTTTNDTSMQNVSAPFPAVVPNVDLWESSDGYRLASDLPGVKLENVSLTLDGGFLHIEGARELGSGEPDATDHGPPARLERTVRVPEDVDSTGVTARLIDGVLEVELPRRTEAIPRKVPISAA